MFKLPPGKLTGIVPSAGRAYTDARPGGQHGSRPGIYPAATRLRLGPAGMPPVRAYYLSPPARRIASPLAAAGATLFAAVATLVLPRAPESASIWAALVALFPDGAPSAFALAWASLIGCIAGLMAEAVARRQALRPALLAVLATALLSPAALAAPLWPALLAAAGLIATPAPRRLRAANDNPIPAHRTPHPFSLAA
jgi:hypothetical protein